uniref:FinTRIM family, member 52, pseudogene n=1 Tax=Cyprinus carpio TaxID=7962 RepID=A0A8C1M8V3_CYPCA
MFVSLSECTCSEMAETSFSQDQFSCPVCLDLLKDPVTIPCGHSYCMSCITSYWDQEDQKGVYSCPQCRQTFLPRPALNKNTVLSEVVEQLKKTKLQASVPAGPEDVECDVCTVRKNKAVTSCLVCLNSYCQNHLQQHENFFKGKRHNLTEATGRLQEMICPTHNKLLEIYCHTDQQCICYLCTMDNHKNHDTVAAVVERTKKQVVLEERKRKFQQKIQQRQKDLEELREAVESHKCSAQTAVKDSERIFTELIHSIERICSELKQRIREREKAAVSRAEGLMYRLEQEIDDLRRRHAELEQLSQTDDHIHFLQTFQSLDIPPESTDIPDVTVSSLLSFDDVRKSVSQLKEKLQDFCREEIDKISGKATYIEIIPTNEPKIREEFLQYSSRLTLDPNTVNKHLCLSERNRAVTFTAGVQQYPDHPDRFDSLLQVLCRESVCGRCYWELEWSGTLGVGISVSYKNISRKGQINEGVFGYNDQSWRLSCSPSSYSFWHNGSCTDFPEHFSCSRIGVYVDHSAGTLSFYSVSNTMNLIYRVQTTFTHPLYPGFAVYKPSAVRLCDLTSVGE